MASRKCKNIYILKYFMGVINCIALHTYISIVFCTSRGSLWFDRVECTLHLFRNSSTGPRGYRNRWKFHPIVSPKFIRAVIDYVCVCVCVFFT